jgi:branched-chain amino acid transport system substrate-binding protein
VYNLFFLYSLLFIISYPIKSNMRALFEIKPTAKKIGLFAPFSGKYKVLGEQVLQGVELTNTELEIIKFDTKGDPIETYMLVRSLVENEDIIAIIGPVLSVNAITAACLADCYKVPLITPTATNCRIRTLSEYVYQLNTSIEAQAIALAEYSTDRLRIRNFAALYPDDNYGTNAVRIFKDVLENRGGYLFKAIGYEPGKKDFKEELLEIRDAAPRGLFIPAYPEDILLIAPQLRYYQVINDSIKILGTNGWGTDEVLNQDIENIKGVIYSDFSSSAVHSEFDSNFLTTYGYEPTRVSSLGYTAMLLISRAFEEGASSKKKLQEWLQEFFGQQGMAAVSLSSELSINNVSLYMISEGNSLKIWE